jgi:hypothetical protein
MSTQNPFDFSDFGPPPTPASPAPGAQAPSAAGGPRRQAAADSGFQTGFAPFAGAPPSRVSPRDAFGIRDAARVDGGLPVAHPPLALFAVAAGLAAAGIVTAAVWGAALLPAAAGWLLAGPVAIGVLAYYTRVDTRRRTATVYSAPAWTSTLYWAVVAVCLIGIAVGAWHLALWVGRR